MKRTGTSPARHNLLIVMADQLTARAVGCYGNTEVITPCIDHLGGQGAVFENAYTSSPLCTPARYAFMTGRNVSRCAGYDNAAYMPATMPTFAHYLRLMGYRTVLCGKMHFVGPDQLHGFEERLTTDIYPADFGWVPNWRAADERIDLWYHNMSSVVQAGVAAVTNQLSYDDEVGARAMGAIYDHARSEDPRSLCLVASFIHPHDPYATRRKYWDLYRDVEISPPSVPRPPHAGRSPHDLRLEKVIAVDEVEVSERDVLNARRAYYGNVSYVDEWLGRLRATLAECGMADNTSVIFTSDHGDMLGEYGLWYKMSFREWSSRIPLIIYNPSRPSPVRVKQAVAHVDILPTLTDLAAGETGAAPPEWIDPVDGRSLLPLCRGEAAGDPDRAVSEYLAEGTAAPMLMIRHGRYKYTCCATDPEELFDLEQDPEERVNLADDPDCAEVMAAFRDDAARHWDAEAVRLEVIADQDRRRAVHAALKVGRYQGWDYDPARDPSQQYTRSHMDLTRFDHVSRYPRPRPFRDGRQDDPGGGQGNDEKGGQTR